MTESSKAVFLSYASQDAEAARRICEALRAAGIEVWFDQSELRGGDSWDHKIRRQIRDCTLFIPIISSNTTSRREGYFRLEWDLADQRTHMIARDQAFIVPVCTDSTPDRGADVPESFLKVQWTRLPGGETPGAFCGRVKILLGGSEFITTRVHTSTNVAAAGAPAKAVRRRLVPAVGAVLVVLIGGWWAWRIAHPSAVVASAAVPVPLPAASEKSIAVLPFVDMSEKHDQEYFSDGLSEELIDHLAHSPDLMVIARTSSFAFKGKNEDMRTIATKLGVANLLEGSVRKAGNELRITAQLIRAKDGVHLWSEIYERKFNDIFKVQDEISTTVARALNVALRATAVSGVSEVPNAEAYNLMLQGNYLVVRHSKGDLERGIELYKKALLLQPSNALATAQLGRAVFYQALNGWGSTVESVAEAKRLEGDALRLDPRLIKAHMVLAYLYMVFDWNWAAAQAEIDQIRSIDSNDVTALPRTLANYSSILGRLPEAIRLNLQDLERDPLDTVILHNLAFYQFNAKKYSESTVTYRRLLALNVNSPGDQGSYGIALLYLGQIDQALRAIATERDEAARLGALAIALWGAGRRADADAALSKLTATYADNHAYLVAEGHAYRGAIDAAFNWLELAYRHHEGDVAWVKTDPMLSNLRDDPRYKAFIVKMKLLEP